MEDLIFKLCGRVLLFSIIFFVNFSCSSISSRPKIHNAAVQAAIQVARPSVEKLFLMYAPISPSSSTRFDIVDNPPGNDFRPNLKAVKRLSYIENGNLILSPGDYIIPVMTYCMNSGGSSPDGHLYVLSRLVGTMAHIIREINLKALPKFPLHDVQILAWSIQNGLSYEEMTSESRQIIDETIPELKTELKQSFIERFAEHWNHLANKSQGLIPSFDGATDEFLEEFGEAGRAIVKIREFRRLIKNAGNNYSRLSELIQLPGKSFGSKPSWSKISDRVYARFETREHFQDIGQIQVRVLPLMNPVRGVSSIRRSGVEVDLSSWLADPMSGAIQPLSFSALYGFAGVLVLPEIAANPILMGMLLGTMLVSHPMDWNAFYEISKLARATQNLEIRRMVEHGTIALHKAHDELERPARELGVIDRRTKNATEDEANPTRNYQKPGGEEALKKDFDKFPGDRTSPKPGVDMKTLPNGSKVLKRPIAEDNPLPTLEIQPPKTGNKIEDRRRIKVRYTKE